MISLIGYRATGKTTLGRKLARRLGYRLKDSDAEVEKLAGKTIAQIFSREGEEHFRDLEEKVIAKLCREQDVVLATGGGAVLRESTRNRLAEAGAVIWLTASPETIWKRMQGDARNAETRPNLTAQGGLEEVVRLLAEREAIYSELATFTLNTEEMSPDELVEEVISRAIRE